MVIIKRTGVEVEFNPSKIEIAIKKANTSVSEIERLSDDEIRHIVDAITHKVSVGPRVYNVEDIQDFVETQISALGKYKLAKNYIVYRYQHHLDRQSSSFLDKIGSILNTNNEEIQQENANKNPTIISTQRDYMAGEVSKWYARERLFDKDLIEAHNEGIIHIHDMDYASMKLYNCCLINMDDMLQNGTVISGTKIDKPRSFTTACNVATQIMAQVASSQLGGQTTNIYHISKFVDVSRQKFIKQEKKRFEKYGLSISEEKFNELIEDLVQEEVTKGVQMIQYQINTLMTTNGQTPFASLFIYLNECKTEQDRRDLALVARELFKQRILGVKNKVGVYVAPAFPKLLYVLDETNCDEDKPYWWLTKLAAECTTKRMVPDYISEKIMREYKEGNTYGCMGCRSFLSVWKDPETNLPKFWGRFNKQVVTLNLPDVALTIRDKYGLNDNDSLLNNEEAMKEFFKLLDERMELCHRALLTRINYLKGTKSDVAPILWQYGAIARLKPGEVIDPLLRGGYSTTSLGFVGLFETMMALTGKPHTDPENQQWAEKLVQYMKERCDFWNKNDDDNYGFSLYGTPEESTTEKFAKALQKRHGIIKDITDKMYVMNSYHTNIREHVDAFTKLKNESKFQKWTNGGAISYIEMPNLINNQEAVLSVIKYIYDNCWYAELNSKIDNCHKCGFSGEIKMIRDENNKLIWECPQCYNRDLNEMTVVRRVCGYLSNANCCCQGRMGDIGNRALHL